MVAAVAVPSLARRLDLAFSDADLQQAQASAKLLPARVATLGIDLSSTPRRSPTATRRQPAAGHPARLGSQGRDASRDCRAPALAKPGRCCCVEPTEGRRWRFDVARLTCEVRRHRAGRGRAVSRRRSRGLSLIEVIVALVVISGFGAALFVWAGQTLQMASRAALVQQQAEIERNITETRVQPEPGRAADR